MEMDSLNELILQMAPVKVRFKYILGELRLGDWFPRLFIFDVSKLDTLSKYPFDEISVLYLPDHADGYCLRRTSVDAFQRGISRHGEWLRYSPRIERLYLVEITGTFDDYLNRRSSKSRKNLKRAVKKVLEQSPDALQIATNPSQIVNFYREASEISEQTYQEKLLGSGLPKNEEFMRSMQECAERGKARAYLLRYQGKSIAFAWCAANGDVLNYQLVGYLPEWASLSPGTVLLYMIIEDIFKHGEYSVLDFGPGESAYKAAFATTSIEYADVFVFQCNWRNRILVWLHWKVERTSTFFGRFLENLGLKKLVRNTMRKWMPFGGRSQ
ncbi:MAG: GNAT family N-acetyltransferase [Desulfuromonadaceae bacterium]|nr:GNAT family N-acetyltransferase [Desulfuromonadaceae bacterium]